MLFLASCLNPDNKKGIVLDLSNKRKEIFYSDFVNSIHTIDLETKDDNLIGDIDQISKDDSLLFLLDQSQKSIFIFTDSGKYVRKANYFGKGEGEYISSTSICLDQTNKILFVYDETQKKILKYNYNLDYLGDIRFKSNDIIRAIGMLANGNFILFTPDYMSRGRDGVWEADQNGEFVKDYKRVNTKNRFVFVPFPYYSNMDGLISFYEGYENTIYSIENDDLFNMTEFNLIQKIPTKYFMNEDGVKHEGTGKYYMNNHIAETKNYYYLVFRSNKLGDVYAIYKKDTGRLIVADKIVDNISLGGYKSPTKIFSYANESFLSLIWDEDSNLNPDLQILYVK